MNKNIIILSCAFLTKSVFGQISSTQIGGQTINPITTAVPFLLISPDSRQGAMGDAEQLRTQILILFTGMEVN